MTKYNLICFKHKSLYQILKELEKEINFKVINVLDKIDLELIIKNLEDYIVISTIPFSKINNNLVLEQTQIKLSKLIEMINAHILKKKFNEQSKIQVGKYYIDLNSKKIQFRNVNIKLTEKEIKIIILMIKYNKPIKLDFLQKKVWNYKENLETHTVETHIYRLRKKIYETFNDNNFIKNKLGGYTLY